MIYFVAGTYFVIGFGLGYALGILREISERNEKHLEETRKSLEKLLVESRIADEILERKSEEDL